MILSRNETSKSNTHTMVKLLTQRSNSKENSVDMKNRNIIIMKQNLSSIDLKTTKGFDPKQVDEQSLNLEKSPEKLGVDYSNSISNVQISHEKKLEHRNNYSSAKMNPIKMIAFGTDTPSKHSSESSNKKITKFEESN